MHASENHLAIELEVGDIVTRGEDWGGQLVRHLTLPPGADFTPLLKGLPGDVCNCPHWGYVISGHTGWTDEGVTFVEFSPAEELRPVLEHVGAQLLPLG